MAGKLEGKVAFITGAARGQGRTHAVRLAEEGADIIGIDICAPIDGVNYEPATPDDLKETVRQVESRDRRMISEVVDTRDLGKMQSVVDRGVSELGRLDVIAGNAGIDIVVPWDRVTPEIMRTTIDINLIGTWNTVRAGVQHLIDGDGGSIILTSSANGIKAGPFNLPYNMSKFGVTALMRSLAMELAQNNVRVNSIHPGAVDTPMADGALEAINEYGEGNPSLSGMLNQWIPGSMPPEEISNALVYLASDASKWVTGLAMSVDGGMAQY